MFHESNDIDASHRVVLSIGSNVGNLKRNIDSAIDLLADLKLLQDIHKSSYYLTEPYGFNTNFWFMNISIHAKTKFDPFSLLYFLKSVEYLLGREKKDEISDRIIDIDILFYDKISLNTHYLTLPHPKLHRRNFMLLPTCEILPDLIHPIFNKTLGTLLQNCDDTLKVIKQ